MGRGPAPFEVEVVRVRRGRVARVTADRGAHGWTLVRTEDRRWGVDLRFQRPRTRLGMLRRPVLLTALLALLVVVATGGILLISQQGGDDTDHDGIPDRVETAGWADRSGERFTSNPDLADSDGDGLPDGLEAGQLVTSTKGVVYNTISDPHRTDSDDDEVPDAEEFFLDMDPRLVDTDSDGLNDSQELDLGSDPTRANGDDDAWSDLEEFDRESDPLSYDLTDSQRVAAAAAGARYGDCYSCAGDHGPREEQIDSVAYLAGQIGSGIAVYGDIRDLACNLWHHKFLAAAAAAVGLIPVYGDGAKIPATLTKFAARSKRAASAASELIKRLPEDIRKRLPSMPWRRVPVLPLALAGGPAENSVYLWKGIAGCPTYVGITRNLAQRTAQHARAGRCFIPEVIASGLTRGKAHALEEACLVQGGLGTAASTMQNLRRSISPTASYYYEAVD